MMTNLEEEYVRRINVQDLREEELGYSFLDLYIEILSAMALLSNNSITIFDIPVTVLVTRRSVNITSIYQNGINRFFYSNPYILLFSEYAGKEGVNLNEPNLSAICRRRKSAKIQSGKNRVEILGFRYIFVSLQLKDVLCVYCDK